MTIDEAAGTLWQHLNGNATGYRDFTAMVGVGGGVIHLSFYRKRGLMLWGDRKEWEGWPVQARYGGIPRLL